MNNIASGWSRNVRAANRLNQQRPKRGKGIPTTWEYMLVVTVAQSMTPPDGQITPIEGSSEFKRR